MKNSNLELFFLFVIIVKAIRINLSHSISLQKAEKNMNSHSISQLQ